VKAVRLLSCRSIFHPCVGTFLGGAYRTANAQGCMAGNSNRGITDELCGQGVRASKENDYAGKEPRVSIKNH
jgi:hypothetical protein